MARSFSMLLDRNARLRHGLAAVLLLLALASVLRLGLTAVLFLLVLALLPDLGLFVAMSLGLLLNDALESPPSGPAPSLSSSVSVSLLLTTFSLAVPSVPLSLALTSPAGCGGGWTGCSA